MYCTSTCTVGSEVVDGCIISTATVVATLVVVEGGSELVVDFEVIVVVVVGELVVVVVVAVGLVVVTVVGTLVVEVVGLTVVEDVGPVVDVVGQRVPLTLAGGCTKFVKQSLPESQTFTSLNLLKMNPF